MIDWLLSAGAFILSLAAYLLVWGWVPFAILFLPDILQNRFRMSDEQAVKASRIICLLGGVAMWLTYSYLLPYPFVRSVTQLVSE